ncbi:MAG: site-specific integrase, partial [Paucibacter sp.]|nr:site-specific integrase [Roseateles sp.]
MASITKRKDSPFWRAQVRRQGFEPVSRTFDTKSQAETWARLVEGEMDRGIYRDQSEAERTSLIDALKRYGKEVVPTKKHQRQDESRIQQWMNWPLARRSLTNLRGADFSAYLKARRAEGKAENTIRLELALVGHLFEVARKEWGMDYLSNPLNNMTKPSGSAARDRRLLPGEFEVLKAWLQQSGNAWAAPAMALAVETALRQGMLFQLRWAWIDLDARLIKIPIEHRQAENKGVPAVLPLSTRAVDVLKALPRTSDGLVFGTTQNAVVLAFKRAKAAYMSDCVKRGAQPAFLIDLRWHDLRHEAATRLFERGLHPLQVSSITGHRSMQMLK